MPRRVFVIGISGVTNGGKSELCNSLLAALPACKVVGMDDYFVEEDSEKLKHVPEVNHGNWEDMSAVQLDIMEQDLRALKKDLASQESNQPAVILVEGILIFNYRPLIDIYDKKYFITLEKEECFKRRSKREYIPADPPGYFDVVVWPMYHQNLKDIQDQNDIEFIEGEQNAETIFQKVHSDITQLIQSKAEHNC